MNNEKSSSRLASIAAAYMVHPDPKVRSLAASVLTQVPDQNSNVATATNPPRHMASKILPERSVFAQPSPIMTASEVFTPVLPSNAFANQPLPFSQFLLPRTPKR
jgi:hypothetical protein